MCSGSFGRRNGALADLCNDKYGDEVEKIADLYKNAQMLVYDLKKAETLMKKACTTEEDQKLEEKYCGCCSKVVDIPTCRHQNILCLKKSAVRLKKFNNEPIHMNKLTDYYKNPIYISQAPTKDEFERYIDAILQEKIGIVVWLTKPNDKLDAYIPMQKGSSTFGAHIIEYEMSGKREEYDFYFIRILPSVKMSLAYLVRVIFVVAHSWTLKAVPKHMTQQSDVISLVQCFHDFTVENGFPGLLVHHSAGVNLTVGFVSVYIGRQMLLDKRKVNVVGIIKYIRQFRHCAFTKEKSSAEQFQTVYMILGSFARNFAYEEIGQLYSTKDEKNLFERAKKANPLPRDAVSAWGDKFSYVKKDKKDSVMHGKITDYEPKATTTAAESEGGEKASGSQKEKSDKEKKSGKESVAPAGEKSEAKDPYLVMSTTKKKGGR